MSDESQIVQLEEKNLGLDNEVLFRNKQLEYINPVGSKSIKANESRITFSFQDEKDHFISLKDAFISIPVTLTSATAGRINPIIAAKQSLLSLINAVRVTTVNNASILDYEKDLHISANLRLLLENQPEYLESIASMIQFDKDYPHENTDIDAYTGANLQRPEANEYKTSASLIPNSNARNPNHNVGFMKRRKYLLEDADSKSTTEVKFTAKIPLKLIHDFFFQLDFPIYYPNIKIEFEFNVGNSSFKPFCSGKTAPTSAVPSIVASAGPPVATVANGADGVAAADEEDYTASLTVDGEARLYYHRIVLPDSEGPRIAKMVEDGFTKYITYRKYNVVDRKDISKVGSEYDISTDSVSTRRVFGLLYPSVGSADGHLYPSPLLTTGTLNNANVWVHKVRQFDRDIEGDAERWQHLSAEFPYDDTNNGPLNYNEFKKRYNILCMNVSRKGDLVNKDSSTVVRVKATPYDNSTGLTITSGEVQWIIEELRAVAVQFGRSGLVRVVDSSVMRA